MKAYVIADIEITDQKLYDEYRQEVPATIAKYGGSFAVRGGRVEALEGAWNPKRVIVLEFPSLGQAQQWYRSAEYQPLVALRQKASRGRLILVEGT